MNCANFYENMKIYINNFLQFIKIFGIIKRVQFGSR